MKNEWINTGNGYAFREFKEGCLEIKRNEDEKPYLFFVLKNLLGEYMEVYELFDGDIQLNVLDQKTQIQEL